MKKILLIIIVLLIVGGVSLMRRKQTSMVYEAGDHRETIAVDGRERSYVVHIPTGFDDRKAYPLLFGFHGGNGTGEKFAGQTGFNEYANREGFMAVFPDGVEHNWNDGRDTTDAFKAGVDDVKFVRALVESLKIKLPIDEKRIYATGISNGGIFTHRLGCEMADVFAAVAPVIGSLATNLTPRCSPAKPISIVVIQGTADPFIPIEGGDTRHKIFPRVGDGGLVESAQNAMRLWASKNGCSVTPEIAKLPPRVNDGTSVEEIGYTQCRSNVEVRYYIAKGMGHGWPPKDNEVSDRISGPTSQNIDATKTIWEFFKAHPRGE